MLDAALISQLKSVFSKLKNDVELVFDHSDHEKQAELLGMLEDLSSTSDHIDLSASGETSTIPHFSLRAGKKDTGISFSGIPGGHEFSSLVLAILNSDGAGKFPDAAIQSRIRRLKGPIELTTYISLTCENCPDVVQNLNLMTLIHPNFKHEMKDGGFVPEEIERLKIQGVPSVIHGDHLVSSGKSSLGELLDKLEAEFGVEDQGDLEEIDLGTFDVAIVGGGPARASAAIYSSRKGLKVAIIADRLGGQLQDTKGIENLISVPYR
ncbi:MAG TPA: alkyl hydroperoxide reductase subunit F, partial [Bdellovibrionales bacterium]|nr:alkyl hydroperoxide reductase subunit F [Bdellovibrionales bacterium]